MTKKDLQCPTGYPVVPAGITMKARLESGARHILYCWFPIIRTGVSTPRTTIIPGSEKSLPVKYRGPDGYMYEPVWIHPLDAEKRGIKHRDLVKLFNERGIVISAAYVTERIQPGALSQDHGSRFDLVTDGLDRGGNNNILMPWRTTSPNATGMVCSGVLVEVAKISEKEMQEWRKRYPGAFNRDYDPSTGNQFNSWIEGGK